MHYVLGVILAMFGWSLIRDADRRKTWPAQVATVIVAGAVLSGVVLAWGGQA